MRNKQGFTLIEIIVSIMIASIGMVIATTLILNSMGYFDKTAAADYDKQALDSVKNYVQDELMYASDVKLLNKFPDTENKKEEWYWLYVKDDVLYRGNSVEINDIQNAVNTGTIYNKDVPVYNNDFYNKRKLQIDATTYESYRVDFKFRLVDKSQTVYKTSTTIHLLNFQNNEVAEPFTKKSESLINDGANTYKVYYKKGEVYDYKQVSQDGTVEDDILCKTEENTEKNAWSAEKTYAPGTFIEYPQNSNKWYMSIKTSRRNENPSLNTNGSWKNVNKVWTENSSYMKNDVVEYPQDSNKYYQCQKKLYHDSTKIIEITNTEYWKPIESSAIPEHKCPVFTSGNWTVGEEDKRCVGDKYKKEKWVDYTVAGQINYPIGTFVEMPDGSVYRAIQDTNNVYTPGSNGTSSIWKKIDVNWDASTNYYTKDIVFYNGDNLYHQVIWNGWVGIGNSPTNSTYWSKGYTLEEINELMEENENLRPTCDLSGTAN